MATLLFVVLQITAILALAGLIARAFLSRSPQLAADVCLLGLVLSVASIPLASLPIPKLAIASFATWQPNETKTMDRKSAKSGISQNTDAAHSTNAELATPQSGGINFLGLLAHLRGSPTTNTASPVIHFVCLACWAVCVALGAIKLAMALPTVWRLGRTSREVHIEQLRRKLDTWAEQHPALSGPKLRVSDRVTSPCVTWLDRNTIYLPQSFLDWPRDEQQAVLAHEAAHLLRRDAQWRLALDILRQVINFHPLAWVLKKQFVLAQEICADREAEQLLSAGRYQKGLCKLALRMDAQPQLSHASLGVSVSTNSLVRRINMLRMPNRRQLSRWQQFAVVACVITLGGGVALCTADEPIRVASRSKKSPSSPAPFTRYTSQPWEEIGVQSGYFRVLPSIAAQRTTIQQPMDAFAAGIGLANLNCGIELSRDWISWTSNIDFKITRHDEDQEHKYSLSMLGDKPLLEFDRKVDWVEVAEKVNLNAFAIGDNRAALKKMLVEQGQSKTLRMVSNSASDYGDHSIAKLLWPVIDGGVTAAVFPLAEADKVDSDYKPGELASEILQVARKCSFVGIGVDFASGDAPCQVRLAFVPNEEYTGEGIAEQSKIALAAILDSMKDTDEMTDDEKAVQASWRRELQAWTVSTKKVDDLGEIVLIEGAVSDTSMVFPLL